MPLPGARRYVFAVRYGDPPDPPAVKLLMEVLRTAAVPPPRAADSGAPSGADSSARSGADSGREIALARSLRLADGAALDYTIAGADVDCKFSHRIGGWMIPPEADGQLMLLVQASDDDGTWSAGLVRAVEENLRPAGNRDGKRALNDRGRAAVRWLHARAPLQENVLIRLPDREVGAIFAAGSGQQRVNELFRRAQRMRVSRTVVATVAMQDDYMKRVRGGGGARDQLRAEGIVIFGDYAGDQVLAAALGLPRPGPGEFVSARLVPRPAEPGDRVYARSIRLAGADWLLASAADPAGPRPRSRSRHSPG